MSSTRRFSLVPLLFVALWCLWLLLPQTRDIALRQWEARLFDVPADSVTTVTGATSRDAAFANALANYGSVNGVNKRAIALEELRRRYPDDAAICAAQIVAMTNGFRIGSTRQAGPSSSADPAWSVKLTKIEPADPKVLASWFAAANRGAKLEPNNTFWDWALIMGLLAARRDDEIWTVLRNSRNKTAFDDHVNDDALARLRNARQRQLTSPLGQIAISASTLFPHYAPMREAARQISDNASGLRLSGVPAKQKQALEGLRDFAQLARIMRRESKSYIGSLVASAIESIALYGGSYSPVLPALGRFPAPGGRMTIYSTHPRSLLGLAQQQKRNDIVAQLTAQWTEMGVWRAKTRAAAATGDTLLIGLSTRDLGIAQAADRLGVVLIAEMPLLLIVAVGCTLMLRFVPMWRREREATPTVVSWIWGPVLSIASILILSSVPLYGLYTLWGRTGVTTFDYLMALMPETSRSDNGVSSPLIWQYNFAALLGVLAGLWFAIIWDARRQGKMTLGAQLRGLFIPPDDGIAHFDAAPLLVLVSILGTFFLLTVGVLTFLIVPAFNSDYNSLHNYAGLVLLGLAIVLILPCLFRLRTAPGRAFALILARRFVWGQLIFLTVVWGLLWLAAVPARKRFDAQFDRQIQIGEFQLIRKKAGL